MKSRLLAPSPEAAHLLDRWDGPAAAPAGSAAGGLATVAETDGVDVASASPSSSPAATRLLQEQNLFDVLRYARAVLPQDNLVLARAGGSRVYLRRGCSDQKKVMGGTTHDLRQYHKSQGPAGGHVPRKIDTPKSKHTSCLPCVSAQVRGKQEAKGDAAGVCVCVCVGVGHSGCGYGRVCVMMMMPFICSCRNNK